MLPFDPEPLCLLGRAGLEERDPPCLVDEHRGSSRGLLEVSEAFEGGELGGVVHGDHGGSGAVRDLFEDPHHEDRIAPVVLVTAVPL